MAKTRIYRQFCPVARSLEVIGEKWSLLIVRDLIEGPQRFSDLLRFNSGITPKWLTLRLRDLEGAGIVERDCQPGRREVWYRLTAKGRELAPVVDALTVWGVEHAMRPPLADEPVHPARTSHAVALILNQRGIGLPRPVTWVIRFPNGRAYTIRYDGARWSVERGEAEPADVCVETTAEAWVGFLMAAPDDRRHLIAAMSVSGGPDQVAELAATFGYKTPALAAP